jgi:pimeloyl-ACP methyl ester carboxylesterase
MEQTKDQQQRLAQTALTVPPDLGHIPQIEDPNAFSAALLKAIGIF